MIEVTTKMEDAYREVCLMFGENPKTTDPADFFGVFKRFVTEWKVRFGITQHTPWLPARYGM